MAGQRIAAAHEGPISVSELGGERGLPQRWLAAIWKFARNKPLGAVGGIVLIIMLAAAVLSSISVTEPLVSPYDPLDARTAERLQGPSGSHWFGTDNLGRDMYSRVVHGAQPSIYTGFLVVSITVTLGLLLGVTSAYAGGWFDLLFQRIVDGLMAFPGLILAMALLSVFASGINIGPLHLPLVWNATKIPLMVVFALVILLTPINARVIRGATFGVMNNQFVEAARAIGASPVRIVLRHLVPNVMAPAIVIATVQLGSVILIESSLSFLGLGLPAPYPSWGGMLQGNGRRFMEIAPWLAIFPGLAISAAVLAFNLLGDALRDVLDPRMRGAGGAGRS